VAFFLVASCLVRLVFSLQLSLGLDPLVPALLVTFVTVVVAFIASCAGRFSEDEQVKAWKTWSVVFVITK